MRYIVNVLKYSNKLISEYLRLGLFSAHLMVRLLSWMCQAEGAKANGSVSESDTESISEAGVTDIDRKQRDLEAKRQQLVKEQKVADQEKLLQCIGGNLGFHNGRPLTAVIIFRSCLHWKSFQVRRRGHNPPAYRLHRMRAKPPSTQSRTSCIHIHIHTKQTHSADK